MSSLLVAGGIYHVCWALFDSSWPRLFAWKRTLAKLDDINRSLLYILSRLLILLYLYIATISLAFREELLGTSLGRSVLAFVAVYWAFRAFMQIQFFGLARADQMNVRAAEEWNVPAALKRTSNRSISVALFIVMLVGIALYLVPAVA